MEELREEIKSLQQQQRRSGSSNLVNKLLVRSSDSNLVASINKMIMKGYQSAKKGNKWKSS